MTVRSREWLMVVCAAALSLSGCKKSEAAAAPAKKAEDPCTFKHDNPKFCFTPPPGFQAKPEEKVDSMRVTRLAFEDAEQANITIEWGFDRESYAITQKSMGENSKASGANVVQEANGYSYDWAQKGGWGGNQVFHLIQVFRSSPTTAVTCSSNSNDAKAATILAACKTLKID